jgi:tRNA(fMet)-specific endonuclease VapC
MAVLIDTSVLVDLERSGGALEAAAGNADRAISVITVSELLHGIHRAKTPPVAARRSAFVEAVLAAVAPLPITSAIARIHAEHWAALDDAGTPVGTHDLWIAATALAHGMAVATRNARDFQRVAGLDVLAL